jgi:hypothetical protein
MHAARLGAVPSGCRSAPPVAVTVRRDDGRLEFPLLDPTVLASSGSSPRTSVEAADPRLLVHRDAYRNRLPKSSKTDAQSAQVRGETDRAKHYPDDGADDSDDPQDRVAAASRAPNSPDALTIVCKLLDPQVARDPRYGPLQSSAVCSNRTGRGGACSVALPLTPTGLPARCLSHRRVRTLIRAADYLQAPGVRVGRVEQTRPRRRDTAQRERTPGVLTLGPAKGAV